MSVAGCFVKFHSYLVLLLVSISLGLIVAGGIIEAWCVNDGKRRICESLFYSRELFSCSFKFLPAAIIFCFIISLIVIFILIGLQKLQQRSVFIYKEYETVARFFNILALVIALILIMVVLLVWFLPSAPKPRLIFVIPPNSSNSTDSPQIRLMWLKPDHPNYESAKEIYLRPFPPANHFNHGPNLYVASFIVAFLALLIFVDVHRFVK